MKKNRNNAGVLFVLLSCCFLGYSQEPAHVVNHGVLSVSPNNILSVEGVFENKEASEVLNDGQVIYFNDFINDGLYGMTPSLKTSSTLFITAPANTVVKQLKGKAIASFYDVQFSSDVKQIAFNLSTNIDVYGTADFDKGIVKVDSLYNREIGITQGMISFHQGAKTINARDESHVDGQVEKIGGEAFQFPKGNKGIHRYARISAPKSTQDAFVGKYVLGDKQFFKGKEHKVGVIKELNDNEYWIIEKGQDTTSDIILTLSWDERTTPSSLLDKPEEELHVVRWDAQAQMWIDEGGVMDKAAKEVTTVANVTGYGFFTLATVKKDWLLDGDVVIYNLVTPNGDGKNDYFIIDKLNNYPNNKVEIFNRWGVKVFETSNYDPNGDGSDNVFRGYAEGKVVMNKGDKLPSGTYYYVLIYEYKDEYGSRMIKKAANLHLETN